MLAVHPAHKRLGCELNRNIQTKSVGEIIGTAR
jgi:hypothetical protein